MIRNYLKIALRNLLTNKSYSFINIAGLAIGMTVCLLMLMYVVNETSYESFHQQKDNIYRVTLDWGSEDSKMKFAGSMPALAPALNAQIPEVKRAVRLLKDYDAVIKNQDNEEFNEPNFFFSDPQVFDIFSFPMIEGNPATALVEPFSIVMNKSKAKKYFGKENPVGKTILVNENSYKITGVIKDIPRNTHMNAEFLASFSTLKPLGKISDNSWTEWGDSMTYLLLQPKTNIVSLTNKLDELLLANTGEWLTSKMEFDIQKLTDIHWDTESRGDIGAKGNIMYIYIFLSAAIFVLIIACFNFINLSTSRYLDRMKEVGVRKVVGANRHQLIQQFLTESFLITVISVIWGAVLFELLYKWLYQYLDAQVQFTAIHFQYLYIIIISMILIVGLFSGGYPALFLSKFKPIDIMRKNTWTNIEKLLFRKIFVVAQFTISIILIIGTIIIYKQLNFMKNSELGFEKEHAIIVYFPFKNEVVKQKYATFRDELKSLPSVTAVSGAYTIPGINSRMNISAQKTEGPEDNNYFLQALPADFGFVSALGLRIEEGRDFSQQHSLDSKESVLVNESAVQALELKNPIGTLLKIPKDRQVRIIGVVKDFHIQSLHHKINPALIFIKPDMFNVALIRIMPGEEKQAIAAIQSKWMGFFPSIEFTHTTLQDKYDSLYDPEAKTGRLLAIFTILALLISCLGILGLASFMINKKIKEIGIRKVLGASATNITILLSRQFAKWVIFSNILAFPLGYYILNKWLQNFAYQTTISWWIYLFAAGSALIIALLSISFQTVKIAHTNPVESLKYE